jgi:diadenosine tetraphosphate (Ap4A) HIT family hydrolase
MSSWCQTLTPPAWPTCQETQAPQCLADGEAAGQVVFHAHLHGFPRFDGDGFGLRFGPGYAIGSDREELEEAPNRIKGAL